MTSFENGYENLKLIVEEFKDFLSANGSISETDTRIKLIDRILVDVLDWPEKNIRREHHSESGFSDYILKVNGKDLVVVEAKRQGESFLLPKDKKHRSLKITGPILTDRKIKEAIFQVRNYCDDLGSRYAIATNGSTWIIFRAINDSASWKEGYARIFDSLDSILESFTEFWNLLSFNSIAQGSLDAEFNISIGAKRNLYRVLSKINNPDVPLLRNSLHTALIPVINNFFADITNSEHLETLKNCYVYSETLKIAATDLNWVIRDSIPKFLKDQGTKDIYQIDGSAGIFGESLARALNTNKGQLFLLLGGIGAGKTTFQKRYQLEVGKDTLDNTIWFVLDFLKPPVDPSDLEPFVWRNILEQLRGKYDTPHLETRQNIKRVFKPEIEALKETALYGLKEGTSEYEKVVTTYIAKWQLELSEYVPRLLALAKPKRNMSVVLFFDNVDQLSPFYQSQIFLLAQNVTGKIGSITIVALREESYYTANVQKVFTAYINKKFHIASPPFRKMIDQRIRYVLDIFERSNREDTEFNSIFNSNLFYEDDKSRIADFLKIVKSSIFEKNKNIALFIDYVCFGNMRLALQMFSTFLVSGATDIDKMLRIYHREGSYYVSFHEFLKSIMLGDRMYYKETYSTILNLFECGQERNSSHFTTIRILDLLIRFHSNYEVEGRGYFEINKLLSVFENTFNNKEDVIKSLNRLVNKQLIESNTRSQENINEATHVRVTSSGYYYFKHLINAFSYLDLVLQDTPIDSVDVANQLADSVMKVNNISGREEEKVERMNERFNRVEIFLNYLKEQEEKEIKSYNLVFSDDSDFHPIIDKIIENFKNQREYISRRIKENHEAYIEDKFLTNESVSIASFENKSEE